ncbi:hypothetical protein EV189_2045 [Motilibacter rhizosphaerae]|uniref:Uncharacterized protein n=1 Tax=Motilibacter rhizosphaerae TaxID=598652 RepID=A0A4Q7NT07_9ACTN|nr:hypothetical protein [Motilibacter rhizosphaerae]RZS90261.1 hypothetical protein EV189_2045 [Motilibacter rhizosphaerae]
MAFWRRSRGPSSSLPSPAPVERWSPLAALALELGQAVALQEAAERVVQGCAAPGPVEPHWAEEGGPVVTELLAVATRIGDLQVAEVDAELKEDGCYLVHMHQAAVDRAVRLVRAAAGDEGADRERRQLQGLEVPAAEGVEAPGPQLRHLHTEVLGLLAAAGRTATAPTVGTAGRATGGVPVTHPA